MIRIITTATTRTSASRHFTKYIQSRSSLPIFSATTFTKPAMHPRLLTAMAAAASAPGNLYFPGEWAPHQGVLMALPGAQRAELKDYIKPLIKDLTNMASAISEFEPVTMIVGKSQAGMMRAAAKKGQKTHGIEILEQPEEDLDLWMRDIAPTYIRCNQTGKVMGLDLNFQAWGGKYEWKNLRALGGKVLEEQNIPRVSTWLVGEGGGIETDGEGTMIAAESSWVNENRNPGKTRDEIETEFKRVFGVTKVIWTPGNRGEDVTDGHIDCSARFIEPGKVMVNRPARKDTPGGTHWYRTYETTRAALEATVDAQGRKLELIEVLEADQKQISKADDELVTSYVNYYLPNGGLVMPSFGVPKADKAALKQFQEIFKDSGRKIVQVPITNIMYFGGGIHCSTQQVLAN